MLEDNVKELRFKNVGDQGEREMNDIPKEVEEAILTIAAEYMRSPERVIECLWPTVIDWKERHDLFEGLVRENGK